MTYTQNVFSKLQNKAADHKAKVTLKKMKSTLIKNVAQINYFYSFLVPYIKYFEVFGFK